MSNTRYIELDSTYRNRNEWPLAAEFIAPLSMSGRKGKLDAVDPVSNSAIETVWKSHHFQIGPAPTFNLQLTVHIITPPPIGPSSGTVILIVESVAGFMQQIEDYYVAAVLYEVATPSTRSRIIARQVIIMLKKRVLTCCNIEET